MADWNPQANSLFLDARELPAGFQREAYLDQACGADAMLRAEVVSLLAADARAGSFLESGAPELPINDSPGQATPLERPGDMVGPYKLLQEIGEGGMGLVFMAEQTDPVRRTVALKIIKPGMDTRQVIARFEAERQALAMMDHPNIAKVFDAGATDAGRPFFVMELVKGTPITKFCEEQRLTLLERLQLIITVCRAVQHAHQKGIIHRDLKPSNVMIAQYDGAPVPKVIDFGVAKATGPRLTGRTQFTDYGTVVGTLEYMSPEQAELNQLDVDTRSDVYSLGVLVYELLTGTTPFDEQRLRSATLDEVRRIIRAEEPPRPSWRLDASPKQAALAAERRSEAHRLSNYVRGDLDWIVMKALDKDRARRYDSPNALARDLEKFLANEPVDARSPSAIYRFRKFARRNRGPVLAAVAVSLSLCVAIALTTSEAIRATRSEQVALAAVKKAETAAAAERSAREAERDQRRKAEELTEFLVRSMTWSLLPTDETSEAAEIWRSADKLKATLANDPNAKATLLVHLGRSHAKSKQYAVAAKELQECLAIAKDAKLIEEVTLERAHCLLRDGQIAAGSDILKSLFVKKLQTATAFEADEVRTAWAGLATAAESATETPGQDGLELDGYGDYVILPDLQFDGRPPWTLETDICPVTIDRYGNSDGSRWTSLVSSTDGGSIGLEDLNGKWSIDLFTAGLYSKDWKNNYSSAVAKKPVEIGVWQHVAGVWDGSELRLYVNGNLEGVTHDVGECTGLCEGPMFLGADPADIHSGDIAQGYFHGRIRTARISHGVEYTDSFSRPERLAATPETIALYDFTIDTGRYAIDRSGHGHHGIIVGAKFVRAGE